jgi:F-type H+-transporting ATPase subunit gamma
MAKARAILKRRKAVRNIKKITKTMQMIATAKFQKSLKRAVSTKPYTLKVRELVSELARSVGDVDHPLLRKVDEASGSKKIAMLVITSDRGLAGAYNGSVLRHAQATIRSAEARGYSIDLFVAGKKGHSFFSFAKRPFTKLKQFNDLPQLVESDAVASQIIDEFSAGKYDNVIVVYMNFISTGVQKPDAMVLLPLSGVTGAVEKMERDIAEKEAQIKAGAMATKYTPGELAAAPAKGKSEEVQYDFSPDPKSLLDELLPLTVKSAFFQSLLDAKTSEHVARMVAMKSATDNADKMGKALAMEYNRARQTQITTELSEIMGGVEAMKK